MKANLLPFLLPISAILFPTPLESGVREESSSYTQENQTNFEEIFNNSKEFFEEVGEEIRREGFNYQASGMIVNKEVRLDIVIRESEPITEEMHEKAQNISDEIIKRYNLDPEMVKVKVGHENTFR